MSIESKKLRQRMARDLVEDGLSYVELSERYTIGSNREEMQKHCPSILSYMDTLLGCVIDIYGDLVDEIEMLEQ